jgi:hypothetical protein
MTEPLDDPPRTRAQRPFEQGEACRGWARAWAAAPGICAHLTFANIVSLLALFVALGGGAYALSIPQNSVGARELKANAVTRAKIRDDAVISAKVRDRSLRARDFRPGELPRGPAGPAGLTGPAGPAGTQGPPGRSPETRFARVKDDATLGAGSAGTTVARVPARPTGWYLITFDLDTRGCTFGAVAGAVDSTYSIIARTTVNAESAALSGTGTTNQVLVLVTDPYGIYIDSPFHLIAYC